MNRPTVQKKCRERAGRLNPVVCCPNFPPTAGSGQFCLLEKRLIARWFLILVCFPAVPLSIMSSKFSGSSSPLSSATLFPISLAQ
jgi:hypothetical protein